MGLNSSSAICGVGGERLVGNWQVRSSRFLSGTIGCCSVRNCRNTLVNFGTLVDRAAVSENPFLLFQNAGSRGLDRNDSGPGHDRDGFARSRNRGCFGPAGPFALYGTIPGWRPRARGTGCGELFSPLDDDGAGGWFIKTRTDFIQRIRVLGVWVLGCIESGDDLPRLIGGTGKFTQTAEDGWSSWSVLQKSVLCRSADAYIRELSENPSDVRADVGIRAPICQFRNKPLARTPLCADGICRARPPG